MRAERRLRRWLVGSLVVLLPAGALQASVLPARAAEPPSVTALAPAMGKTSGGNTVAVTGTGLTGSSKVMFGSKAGTKLKVISDTALVVTAPPGSGTVDVRVITASGTSATVAADKYRYVGAPTVARLSVTSGGTAGGTTVTITGGNLLNVTKVVFGSAAGKDLKVDSETSLSVTAPAHKAGRVDVRITTAYGTSSKTSKDRFTYVAPPKISSISPNSSALTGGVKVTLKGSGFTKVSKVTFGEVAGTGLKVSSSSKLTVVAPAGAAGLVDVRVIGAYGSSQVVKADRFTYVAPPSVTRVSPNQGPVKGGTKVTLTGTNFSKVSKVTFGGKPGTKLKVKSMTSLTINTPAQATSIVDVRVATVYGISPTVSDARFTYGTPAPPVPAAPTITGISPTSGTTAGGTTVTITGTNLTGTTKVTIGGTTATNLTITSNTQVTATTAAHGAGTVDVVLTTPGGTVTKTNGYTYVAPAPPAPTITGISPSSGTTAGGTTVTITGTNLTGTTKVTIGGTTATNLTINAATTVTATTPEPPRRVRRLETLGRLESCQGTHTSGIRLS